MSVGSDLEGTAEIRVAIMQSGEQLEIATVRGKNSNSWPTCLSLCYRHGNLLKSRMRDCTITI